GLLPRRLQDPRRQGADRSLGGSRREDRGVAMRPGETEKQEGMATAADGAGSIWLASAEAAVRRVASSRETFTTDDVWLAGLPNPGNPRALGAVMHILAREGAILQTGEMRKSVRPVCHRRPLAVWRLAAPPLPDF
ncbi:MAG: hypothetical protein Q7R39_02375, partial [Dehalococcoidia bacterium]|nr:hypothetical protein [Dehalococcoidia bacterium]